MNGAPRFLMHCPFCHGQATMIDRPNGPVIFGAYAGCDSCEIYTPIKSTATAAAQAWNRREEKQPAAPYPA